MHRFFDTVKQFGQVMTVVKTSHVALHSILLTLEPRMVFDASVVAAGEAVDNHDAQPAAQAEASHEPGADGGKAAPARRLLGADGPALFGFGPQGWNDESSVAFNNTTTVSPDPQDPSQDYQLCSVQEDTEYAFGDGIVLSGPDSGYFKLAIPVDGGVNANQRSSIALQVKAVADLPLFDAGSGSLIPVKPKEGRLTKIDFNYGSAQSPQWESLAVADAGFADAG